MQDDPSPVVRTIRVLMSVNPSECDGDGLSTDTIMDLLSHQLRRELLLCLQDYDEPLALADAADELAVATNDVSSLIDVDPETVKQIYMSLYHSHIPKLVEYNVVEYDQERDLIALVDHMIQLDPFLDLESTTDSL